MNMHCMDSSFLDEVRGVFEDLIAGGVLRVVSSTYDERAFGNAAVVLAGRNFQVRVVRDRGEGYAHVWPLAGPEEWWPVQRVLHALGVVHAEPEGLVSVVNAARLVRENLDTLEDGLSPVRYSEVLRALRELDAEALKRMGKR